MKQITKQEMDYLISSGIIKLIKYGSSADYGDNLVVSGKQHRGNDKTRFTTDDKYNSMIRSKILDKLKKMLDSEQLKDVFNKLATKELTIIELVELSKNLEKQNLDLLGIKFNQRYMFT